jgi:hypothetical protein
MKLPPGLTEDDALFIARNIVAGRWTDAEYYGPGAAEAEARRAATLAKRKTPILKTPPAPKKSHAPKKRKALAAIERRIAELRAKLK